MSMHGGWNPVNGADAMPSDNLNLPYEYRETKDGRQIPFIPKEALSGQSAEDLAKTYYGSILKYKYDPYLPKSDRQYFRLLASAAKKSMSDARRFSILRTNAGMAGYRRHLQERAADEIYSREGMIRPARTPEARAARWRKLVNDIDFNQRNASCVANGMNPDTFEMARIAPFIDDPKWASYDAYKEANAARGKNLARARKDALARLRAQYRGPDGRISKDNAELIRSMMRNPRRVGLRNITNFRGEDQYAGLDEGDPYEL